MLEHAFGELALARVALCCVGRNARSHQAIAPLGACSEGTVRRFRSAADATVADIDCVSILREEWPQVQAGLRDRLGR